MTEWLFLIFVARNPCSRPFINRSIGSRFRRLDTACGGTLLTSDGLLADWQNPRRELAVIDNHSKVLARFLEVIVIIARFARATTERVFDVALKILCPSISFVLAYFPENGCLWYIKKRTVAELPQISNRTRPLEILSLFTIFFKSFYISARHIPEPLNC